MPCYYEGYRYAEGAYVCQGEDKYVCFENRWLLSLKDAPECKGEEIVGGWKVLKTVDVTLVPSEEVIGGWKILQTIDIVVSPSEEVVGGWKVLQTIDVVVYPQGEAPPPTCTADSDCPAGYICVDGKCVKKEGDGEVPWPWIAAGAAGIGGIALLTSGKKPVK